MMNDELEVDGIDGETSIAPAHMQVFDMVDTVVDSAIVMGDITPAIRMGVDLRRSIQVRGLALAKLLYKLKTNWEAFYASGVEDEFYDVIHSELGLVTQTVRKYATMWEVLFEEDTVPVEVKRRLFGKPIKSLLLLPAAVTDVKNAIKEGEEPKLDWNDVVQAATHAELNNVVRKVRGEVTSSSSRVVITYDKRTGSLYAYQGADYVEFGFLNERAGKLAQIAIERILNSSGISER